MKEYEIKKILNDKIYTEDLFKIMKSILNDPKSFNKSNFNNRLSISERLNNLSILKDHTDIFDNNKQIYSSKYLEEYEIFKSKIIEKLNEKINRIDSGIVINQMKISLDYLENILINNGYINDKISYQEVIEKLEISDLFDMIVLSTLSSIEYIGQDSSSTQFFNIKDNEIDHIKLFENLQSKIILKFSYLLMKNNELKISSGLYYIHENIEKIKKDENNESLQKFTLQLIDIFLSVFKCSTRQVHYINENNARRSLKLISLPESLLNSYISRTHIPEIIPIDNDFIETKDFIISSKKIKEGVSKIELSDETIRALKISQKKKFKVNKNTILLFNKLDKMSYDQVKNIDSLPFVPIAQIEYLIKEVNKYNFLVHNDYSAYNYKNFKILEKELELKIKCRKLHNTIMKFAEIFDGFPIYFMESFDYRIRMYTVRNMFSRTTGIRKYFLEEFKSIKLTSEGLINMLKAFYSGYTSFYDSLNKLINNKESISKILEWNNNNIDKISDTDILNEDNYFYKFLLREEIKKLEENKMKTSFMIEIDQKNSGLVITSIITGDIELAKHCNLISDNNETKDAAKMLMEKSYDFFKNKISDETLNIISKKREIHKKIQMFSLYNQKANGRRRVLNYYKLNKDDIIIIANKYDDFLDCVYENLSLKRKKINNIIDFYLQYTNKPLEINTLDGSKLTWYVFNKSIYITEIKKYLEPNYNKSKSYRDRKRMIESMNSSKMLTGFLPSLIHSIDGSIIRMLLLDMYDNNNYIITHLHDSIQFHPNQYNNVINSLFRVYSDERMKNIMENNVFNVLKNRMLPQYYEEFDKLIKDFKDESYKEIEVNKNSFNPENMYPFE